MHQSHCMHCHHPPSRPPVHPSTPTSPTTPSSRAIIRSPCARSRVTASQPRPSSQHSLSQAVVLISPTNPSSSPHPNARLPLDLEPGHRHPTHSAIPASLACTDTNACTDGRACIASTPHPGPDQLAPSHQPPTTRHHLRSAVAGEAALSLPNEVGSTSTQPSHTHQCYPNLPTNHQHQPTDPRIPHPSSRPPLRRLVILLSSTYRLPSPHPNARLPSRPRTWPPAPHGHPHARHSSLHRNQRRRRTHWLPYLHYHHPPSARPFAPRPQPARPRPRHQPSPAHPAPAPASPRLSPTPAPSTHSHN